MLDIRWIRQNPEEARSRLAMRGAPARTDAVIDRILELDKERRNLAGEGDDLKARRNAVSQQVGQAKRNNEPADHLLGEMTEVGNQIRAIDIRLREIDTELDDLLLRTPNTPEPDIPVGGEDRNQVVREWGEIPRFEFTPRPHWELGSELGLFDLPM